MTKKRLKQSLIQPFSGKAGKGKYFLTALGLEHVREMATLGMRPSDICDYLGVESKWLDRVMDEDGPDFDPDVDEAMRVGHGEFKLRLHRHQMALSETNATMAIWMGKVHLDQKDKQEVEHTHKHQVIGTLPDYDQSSSAWKKQFAPDAVQKIEEQKRIEIEDIEEIEIVEEPNTPEE